MIDDIITKALDLLPATIPQDWDEHTLIQLEDISISILFKNGKVSLSLGDKPDAESIIHLSKVRFCNAIDGTTDFMTVWRELAEPSPTDRTTIRKGTGAKFFALVDHLCKCYKSSTEFKKLLDDYKASL